MVTGRGTRLYEDGQGVAQDLNQALYWYQKATDQNYPLSKSSALKLKLEIAANNAQANSTSSDQPMVTTTSNSPTTNISTINHQTTSAPLQTATNNSQPYFLDYPIDNKKTDNIKKGSIVKVIHNYFASSDIELSVNENDRLVVLRKENDKWLYCWSSSNITQHGLVPINYVEEIPFLNRVPEQLSKGFLRTFSEISTSLDLENPKISTHQFHFKFKNFLTGANNPKANSSNFHQTLVTNTSNQPLKNISTINHQTARSPSQTATNNSRPFKPNNNKFASYFAKNRQIANPLRTNITSKISREEFELKSKKYEERIAELKSDLETTKNWKRNDKTQQIFGSLNRAIERHQEDIRVLEEEYQNYQESYNQQEESNYRSNYTQDYSQPSSQNQYQNNNYQSIKNNYQAESNNNFDNNSRNTQTEFRLALDNNPDSSNPYKSSGWGKQLTAPKGWGNTDIYNNSSNANSFWDNQSKQDKSAQNSKPQGVNSQIYKDRGASCACGCDGTRNHDGTHHIPYPS